MKKNSVIIPDGSNLINSQSYYRYSPEEQEKMSRDREERERQIEDYKKEYPKYREAVAKKIIDMIKNDSKVRREILNRVLFTGNFDLALSYLLGLVKGSLAEDIAKDMGIPDAPYHQSYFTITGQESIDIENALNHFLYEELPNLV